MELINLMWTYKIKNGIDRVDILQAKFQINHPRRQPEPIKKTG